MTSSDLIQYLANVIHIVRADNQLTPAEDTALAAVVADMGAKKREVKDAERVAADATFEARPVGRYSEQIRNVEDMVYVALADGDLAECEKARIIEFARQLGVTQDQVDRIAAEARARAMAQTTVGACPKCRAECQVSAKFCPECGASIQGDTQARVTKLAFDYPKSGVAVEFAETTAATFEGALRAAKAAPSYQEIERSKKRWFLAAWPGGTIPDSLDVVANLKGVRNRKVYIDGTEQPWDMVFGFRWCSEQRQTAYKPAEYCFGADDKRPNLWGCKQIRMEWEQYAEWFTYGTWVGEDTFQFDKDRIAHEVKTNAHRIRFCPHLRRDLLRAVFALLPDRVRVSEQEGWKYRQSYKETPNSIKIVQKTAEDDFRNPDDAVTLVIRTSQSGYTYKSEFFTDGVMPVGFEVARAVLKRAFSQCGITDVDIQRILP